MLVIRSRPYDFYKLRSNGYQCGMTTLISGGMIVGRSVHTSA